MKKLLYFILSVVLLSLTNCDSDDSSDKSYNDEVLIYSQQSLNEFAKNQYEIINGNLIIQSSTEDPVTDLSILNTIEEINGNLSIENTEIETLQGLQNLRKVNKIIINENPRLLEINLNLPFLTLTSLVVQNNFQLLSIEIANQNDVIDSRLEIKNNYNLSSLEGFESLESINGILSIEDNPQLTTLDFPQLNYANRLNIRSSGLEIANFPFLENVNLSFDLWQTQLENFEGFPIFHNLNGRFTIIQNSQLVNWCDISDLVLGDEFDFGSQYFITTNAYNPSFQDWVDGNCSL